MAVDPLELAAAADVEPIWRPHVTVAAVVEREGRFLFVEERVRGELVLNQPAGHLDPGETLAAAAVRETLEETGWEVRPAALIAVYQWVDPVDREQMLRFTFSAEPLRRHAGRALDDGIERAVWLAPQELDAHAVPPRTPLVRRSLDDFLAGVRLPLEALRAIDWGREA